MLANIGFPLDLSKGVAAIPTAGSDGGLPPRHFTRRGGVSHNFVGKYGYFLFRRCHAYLGDPASAHDAVQEVFVRALGHAHAFRGDCSPRTWLCRIADHLCVDLLRRKSRNPVQFEPVQFDVELAAHVRADDADSLVMARRLLEQLEPESRRLAVLYYCSSCARISPCASAAVNACTTWREHALRSRSSIPRPTSHAG